MKKLVVHSCARSISPLLSLSEGGVLRIVNGPTTDKKRKVPVQGFTIRVADKALIQTWPSENRQVMPPYIELRCCVIDCYAPNSTSTCPEHCVHDTKGVVLSSLHA